MSRECPAGHKLTFGHNILGAAWRCSMCDKKGNPSDKRWMCPMKPIPFPPLPGCLYSMNYIICNSCWNKNIQYESTSSEEESSSSVDESSTEDSSSDSTSSSSTSTSSSSSTSSDEKKKKKKKKGGKKEKKGKKGKKDSKKKDSKKSDKEITVTIKSK